MLIFYISARQLSKTPFTSLPNTGIIAETSESVCTLRKSQRDDWCNCLEQLMGELDNRFTHNGKFEWKGTLKGTVTAWRNCTSNRCVFQACIFSSSQVPVHSDFWEGTVKVGSMCYPLCSKRKTQEAAVCIYDTQVLPRQSIPETEVMKYCLTYVCSNGMRSRKTSQRFLVSMVRNLLFF